MLYITRVNSKRAQGLPINTVILAALALVVLLVMFGILTGKIKWFGQGLATCPGECSNEATCNAAGGFNLGGNYLAPSHQKDTYPLEGATCAVRDPKSPNNVDQSMFCCSARRSRGAEVG